MINVTKTSLPPLERYVSYLERIWSSGQLTNNGPFCGELASALKQHLGLANLELVSNGTLALQLAIKALGIQGEVITTPYSYVATVNAIIWEGCVPVFVDIAPDSLCIDPDLIEGAITDHTSAILATHVYGNACDVTRIGQIAKRHGLKVIYDGAHAFGVRLHGRSLLEHGDCSTLSFHATKIFQTAEGGAVACAAPDVAGRLSLISRFGHTGEEDYKEVGINAKLSELHAAMGLAVLPELSYVVAMRRECSAWYDEGLAGCALQRPVMRAGLDYNYAYYPVIFPTHQAMMRARQHLMDRKIYPRRYFHPSLNTLSFLQPEWQKPCPISEGVAQRVLVLPVSHQVDAALVQRICRIVKDAM
jgi:dTDP-4-amino-4,6-dideoxygalactose transaminase